MTSDPVEEIAAALARLRGSRAPFRGDPGGWARGAEWPGHAGEHGHHGHARGLHGGPHGGPPPWVAGAARFGGGPARFRLLDAIAAASHPLSVSEAAEAIGVDQPRASRLVQQAVEMGLARREPDPDDARRTRVALTDAGAALVRGFRGERRDAVRSALEGFTAAEQAELARLLTKLADAWPRR